jgi:hypothetical protein
MIECRPEVAVAPHLTPAALDAAFVEDDWVRNIFVQVNCGQIVPLEVPFEMSDQQVFAEFAKGQLIALANLVAGLLLLFALIFLS